MPAITDEWLAQIGFRWAEMERANGKHWILWMGGAVANKAAFSNEDLGIELNRSDDTSYYCWIRADYCGRYSRFVHIRHMKEQAEVIALIEAVSGFPFSPANVYYGTLRKPEDLARIREYHERIEVRLAAEWGSRVEREKGSDPHKIEKLKP
jgi:hypothetical protein